MISANQTLCLGAACCLSLQVLSPEPSTVEFQRPAPALLPLTLLCPATAQKVRRGCPSLLPTACMTCIASLLWRGQKERRKKQEVLPCCSTQSSRAPKSHPLSNQRIPQISLPSSGSLSLPPGRLALAGDSEVLVSSTDPPTHPPS